MRLSKMAYSACGAALSCLLLFSACDGFFTTSVASALARDIDYSSLSLDELLSLAASKGATSSDAAKEILAALASMSEEELTRLSVEQKSTILETAVSATIDIGTVLTAVEDIMNSSDEEDILTQISSLIGSDVDMTAVKVLLADEETLESASVDTILLASVALVTTIDNEDVETLADAITEAIESGSTDSLSENLSDNLLETAETIYTVVTVLEDSRADDLDEFASSLGLDLSSLIPGFGS